MAPRISLALILHNHQPVGNFGWVIESVYGQAYEPMIGALERHPRVRVGLHYSGPLIDWLKANRPEALDRLRALVDREQVEILGGAYYEPILVALPERDRQGQLERMREEIARLFGRKPAGAWLAERVWEPSLPSDLGRAGYRYTVLDDNHLRGASVRPEATWGTYTTDDQGQLLTVFGTEQGLRYRIPFREVDELIDYLREHASEDGARVGIMGDDGEKFGSWPGTFEHCWGEGQWVEHCFEALETNSDWLTTVRPSDWLGAQPSLGRIYIPASSYLEMTEWALPPDEQNVFVDLIEAARELDRPEARFLQGGLWRNFQARYREINDLHKQMLRVSRKVATMPAGPDRRRAIDHLYQGQSNDCYWHGLFGGIYLVHMRMATLSHLIAAEDIADRAAPGAAPAVAPGTVDRGASEGTARGDAAAVVFGDLDLDGQTEALMRTEAQTVVVDLAEGAGIGAWDLRATRVALAAVLRRRPEAYHEKLRAHDRAAAAGAEPGGAAKAQTIHEIVAVKEPGLSERIVYDWHERRGGLVHLLPAAEWRLSARDISAVRYTELGDFVDHPFEVVESDAHSLTVRRDGHLHVEGGPHPLVISKKISTGGDRTEPRLRLDLTVENVSGVPVEFELALEWGINLMGGGNPSAYYELAAARIDADGYGGEGEDGADGGPSEPGVRRWRHDSVADETVDAVPDSHDGRLSFGNEDAGVRVEAAVAPGARVSWFPIETISNSEAGFERIYQGSSLVFRWPVAIEAGGRYSNSVRFQVRQTRDLEAEERGAAPEQATRVAQPSTTDSPAVAAGAS
jgi:4-alpha-glucanotransferase